MLGVLSTNPPEFVSTVVMGSVFECHDQGFHYLGGMVPDLDRVGPQVYASSNTSVAFVDFSPAVRVTFAGSVLSEPAYDDDALPVAAGASSETAEVSAVRHFRALMGRDRDGRMLYLSDAGMEKAEIASLVALVVRWLGEAGLERLGVLSRMAVEGELGPGHVLERWISWRSNLDLALLLNDMPIGDWELAVAYSFAHASELVLASYWSDGVPDDETLSLVPGDDLD